VRRGGVDPGVGFRRVAGWGSGVEEEKLGFGSICDLISRKEIETRTAGYVGSLVGWPQITRAEPSWDS
jgi:hypothetical protein